jgi:glycosyltransferase involved in cell wall biosynthesis
MDRPKISLIIPAYNEEKYLGDCLKAATDNSAGRFHEIIVIDNASTDHTREVAEKFPGVRVVREEQKGLTRARARGLAEATGDLLAYIDADTRLPKNWLGILLDFYDKNPGAVCLSGPYHYYDGNQYRNFILHILWWIYAPTTYRFVGYMVLGGNFVARREALLAMGGFDKTIEFYGEDTDIARRLNKLGKVVFKMNFFIYSSSRRFNVEGIFKTNYIYTMNFLWEVFFHRPYTKKYQDIRPNDK